MYCRGILIPMIRCLGNLTEAVLRESLKNDFDDAMVTLEMRICGG